LLALRGSADGARADLRPAQGPENKGGVDWFAADGVLFGDERFDGAWTAWWQNNQRIRCPFWRRRGVEMLEAALTVGRFVLARHKSLSVPLPYLDNAASAAGGAAQAADATDAAMAVEDVLAVIEADFTERQYYVTGRLSKAIYADDCFFDAPDPDMPVRGRRKYVDAVSHLFVHKSSRVDLLSIEALQPGAAPPASGDADAAGEGGLIVARWRLSGVLALPWRPEILPYTGVTLYQLDARGRVRRHTEHWSVTAPQAFLSTLLPALPLWGAPAPEAAELRTMPGLGCPDPALLLRERERVR